MSAGIDCYPSKVLYIPHGGGPLPLLHDPGHHDLADFLKHLAPTLGRPEAIVVISAHWEEDIATLTGGEHPDLIYDYSGFPEAAYHIRYPAPGHPRLAERMQHLLQDSDISARLDNRRGFDHGMFVPLKILFPNANIPCVQISLLKHLDAAAHIAIGKALTSLRQEKVLILGSGFSFHNLRAFFSSSASAPDEKNEAFEQWLIETCTALELSAEAREDRLINWQQAPAARYSHPREEHLLPLHVCYGLAQSCAKLVFSGKVAGKKASAFLW